ncbi:hypothetical protein OEZ86_012051 [Tetradesmus obliquus]|uniref:PAS domain-containing protein n=1 Tax=Tetradesmus obliquus TaxID=3088 RepID=A0A383VQJ6_TETOB|nr:hypothetical protein OEZ86_012051 [Tetradesmus obliquus]|eukprot:jgi/Sobl393_1/17200/SZX67173.1
MALSAGLRNSCLLPQGLPALAQLSRSVATYAFTTPKESLARQVVQEPRGKTSKEPSTYRFSLRNATASVARRHQWQTMPIEAPKSLEAVQLDRESPQARIVTEACYPYRVVYANRAWEQLCGWSADEACGRCGLAFMQGEATDRIAVARINEAVREGERVAVTVVNYKKDGTPFLNQIQIAPLRSSCGEYTHMLGILSEVTDAKCEVPPSLLQRCSSEQRPHVPRRQQQQAHA